MNIQEIFNSNCFPGRDGHVPKFVILHGTAGGTSAQAIANYFKSTEGTNNPVSAHYVIGTDGVIIRCNHEQDGAWSNGILTAGHDAFWDTLGGVNPNNVTISIEHCKASTNNQDVLTPAQQTASFTLVQDICSRLNIPMQPAGASGGVTGHYSLDPISRRNCPGPYAWDELWTFLKQGGTNVVISLSQPEVAQYFEQAKGAAWSCKPYKTVIGGAILDFYKAYGNTALCGLTFLGLPLGNEIGIAQNCTIQRFEAGVLAYDPNHRIDSRPGYSGSVFPIKIYSGIGADPRIQSLQAQIQQLQAQLAQQSANDPSTQLKAQIQQDVADMTAILQKIEALTRIAA